MLLSEWREFPSAPCLAGKKKTLMTTRVSMLLKSRASLTCFRACVLPCRAKDLSAPRYIPLLPLLTFVVSSRVNFTFTLDLISCHLRFALPRLRSPLGYNWKSSSGRQYFSVLVTCFFHLSWQWVMFSTTLKNP